MIVSPHLSLVPAPDTSSHSIKPSKMKRQSAGRHGERLDSGIHYHCNTLPRMSSTVCANEPEERMRRERKMGSASQPISTSSSLTRTPYKRDNNTLSLGGVATSHETTPITSVSRRTLNEQILLPLVGQRSGGMRKKSDVQFPWQPKNLSLGGVGVARAWGMSVRRRRRMWSSACEDVEEEVTAEDNSSISGENNMVHLQTADNFIERLSLSGRLYKSRLSSSWRVSYQRFNCINRFSGGSGE